MSDATREVDPHRRGTARRVYSSRLFKLAFSVLVAVASFVVVVAVVEGLHWIKVRHGGSLQGAAIRFDPLLGWAPDEGRFIHGHGEVRINTAGFRSSELVPDRPTIAMLGDSIAYGLGHANRDTPSSYLERLVGPRGFQVQNLSAPGYGTDQSYLRLRERIDELEAHRDGRIVVHCHHGGRSMQVTQALRSMGFEQTQNMAGGIDAWSQLIDDSVPRY